jgi:D-sedoheptulose 7-phosphate isomerase
MIHHPHHKLVAQALGDAHRATVALMGNQATVDTIAEAGSALGAALKAGHRVFSCGNGGSMADAMHFAEELTGRYRQDRAPLAAQAISDPTHLSCVANDYGYDKVFSRYIEAHGRPGDWLLAISTSGNSPNVLLAADMAHDKGMVVIGLSAIGWNELYEDRIDFDIRTPTAGTSSDRVQELHIKVIHILVELVERVAFGVGK